MKKKTKIIIALAAAALGTLVLGACTTNSSPYGSDSVSIRYDCNGGVFGSSENTSLVDVFSYEKLEADGYVIPVAPGDPLRGVKNPNYIAGTTATKSGYFLVGWYREKTPRVNEQGEALDEYGEPCSETGRDQGYTYSGYWDFGAKQKLTLQDVQPAEKGKGYAFTLYAAWASYSFTFYHQTEQNGKTEWTQYGSHAADPKANSIELPAYDPAGNNGSLNYKSFPEVAGYTFQNVYATAEAAEAGTDPITEAITHPGTVDLETGYVKLGSVSANIVCLPCYVTERVGKWYRVYTAQQLANSAQSDGYYEIMEDLDFTDVTNWNFSKMTFTGGMYGMKEEPVKFSNLKVTSVGVVTVQSEGGVFGRFTQKAELKNIAFENITFLMDTGRRATGARFGTFAGEVGEDVVFENFTFSGTLQIGDVSLGESYDVGLFSGNLLPQNSYLENIKLECPEVKVGFDENFYDKFGWPVKATKDASGRVTIEINPDNSVDPNLEN